MLVYCKFIPSWPTETVANTKLYYNNNGNPQANLSYPAGCTPAQTAGSNNLYKLNATTNKTGLEFMMKVMAGDHVDIFGKSYYLNTTNITNTNSTTLDILSLLTNLLLSPGNAAAAKGLTGSQLNTMNNGLIPTSFFRGNNSESATTVPKAYINYIFLDEQFKYAGGGASRVGTSGVVKDHWQADAQLQNITVPKNGYIFVYVSNESNFDVFFDNLQVIHKPGPLLEETHYYPFGLTMTGISSNAALGLENKYKYNGKELQHNEFAGNSGLELYDFGARMQDPQLGRWWTVDPLADKRLGLSTYNYCSNNPFNNFDPNGLTDYTLNLNRKTGEVKIVGKSNKDPDRILRTNGKGKVKYKRNGQARVAIGGIEHGILKDGMNFNSKDNIFNVGGKGQPSVAGVKSFTLQLSEYVGKEIKGFSYSADASGNVTDMVLGRYVNNTLTSSYGSPTELQNKYGVNFSFNNVVQEFHTHPNGELGATQSAPELSQDVTSLQSDKPQIPNASFIILYRITGQIKPAEYDYTNEYIPKKEQ